MTEEANKKFRVLRETKEDSYYGTLHRIEALRDFGTVKKGDIGGWVESEDNLAREGNCWIADEARVSGNSRVLGNALVCGNSVGGFNSIVDHNAVVSGNAMVFCGSVVSGSAVVTDRARVLRFSLVAGTAEFEGTASISAWGVNSGVYTEGAQRNPQKPKLATHRETSSPLGPKPQ